MASRRDKRLYIWLDVEKKELIQSRAIEAGMTTSEFVISASINSSINQNISLNDRRLLIEIGVQLKALTSDECVSKRSQSEIDQLVLKIKNILK